MGSPAAAALLAHLAFVALIVLGATSSALSPAQIVVAIALWIIGAVGLRFAPYEPARAMFSSYVAVLDIALVFMIVKGDVRLS